MKTILIVEDERNQCELYSEELQEEGYHVFCAHNGREAIE
jgi:CheY-like chemotaxis protein